MNSSQSVEILVNKNRRIARRRQVRSEAASRLNRPYEDFAWENGVLTDVRTGKPVHGCPMILKSGANPQEPWPVKKRLISRDFGQSQRRR